MCRSVHEGGRRCPGHQDPARKERVNAAKRLKYAAGRNQPVSNAIFNRHIENAYELIEQLRAEGMDTVNLYGTRADTGQVTWDADRVHLHAEIVEHFTSKWVNVPRERQAVISGGLAGSGKTTTLANHAGIDIDEFALLSPDDIKEVMAEKGMFSDIPGLTPMESSALGYEEATHLTNVLLEKAVKDGYNLIYDTTMGSVPATVSKLQPMVDKDYRIRVVFVDIDVDTSLRRSQERHRAGLNEYLLHNRGFGGRLLPKIAVVTQQPTQPGYLSRNKEVFDELKQQGWFQEAVVYSNNVDGQPPILKESH